MIWKKLEKTLAKNLYEEYLEKDSFDCDTNEDYKLLKVKLERAYYKSKIEALKFDKKKIKYNTDMLFGFELYKILNSFSFGLYEASDNEIWNYLSLKVVPNLVFDRWHESINTMDQRFYRIPRRIWLKYLWWYIYSTYQTENGNISKEKTIECLRHFNTDYILQLTERTGSTSNPTLTREMTKAIAKHQNDGHRPIYRNSLKYHNAKRLTIEPAFFDGGEEGYSKMIVDWVVTKEGEKNESR